ncbi:hypothetical protein NJT12_23895, partial [Flavobacterium sp. AC]
EKFIEDPILAQIYIFQETLCKSTSIIKERGRLFRQPPFFYPVNYFSFPEFSKSISSSLGFVFLYISIIPVSCLKVLQSKLIGSTL